MSVEPFQPFHALILVTTKEELQAGVMPWTIDYLRQQCRRKMRDMLGKN